MSEAEDGPRDVGHALNQGSLFGRAPTDCPRERRTTSTSNESFAVPEIPHCDSPLTKIPGEPDAENLHVRFDEGRGTVWSSPTLAGCLFYSTSSDQFSRIDFAFAVN